MRSRLIEVRGAHRVYVQRGLIVLCLIACCQNYDARAEEAPHSAKDIAGYIEILREGNTGNASTARATLARIGEPAVPALVAALKDKESVVRAHAAEALSSMGAKAKAAVPALISSLKDESWEVRLPSAEALGRIGVDAKAAVPSLIIALSDNDDRVAAAAAGALRAVGPEGRAAIPA